ncbi:hypothetical protein M3689_02925 [Alkalihalophilus marmarensis]|jgi:hypothetical protein|uniref:Uncharacterized protein n=1 Tax=Alkalihalophilus marmarensis DSM 21297 TaxID=1188261 RepID=U6SU05_9BACI|nr:hypothetical protein [Alkalihalophilus marmarensis]ERN54370.1 hypothetical protein A33I_08095 [Alkalihalophilus marmarensis DSM 21297]MCM3488255.1 hypothetical protein [Alkalihalophilus marmarensis]
MNEKEYMSTKETRREIFKRELEEQFKKPLIHKAIATKEVFVPLDTTRIWN